MAKSKELQKRIIDVEAIGRYIEKLRNDKGWTRRYLAFKVNGVYDEKSIDDWERRGVLPNQESLISLAEIFNVPIDDLLEGGKQITKEELLEKYSIFKLREYKPEESLENIDLYTPHQTQLILINQRLKELIIQFNTSSLTRNEDFELRFLFGYMCELNSYVKKLNIKLTNDKYLDFIKILNYLKNQNLSKNAFYWEVQKYIKFNNEYRLYFLLDDCVSNQKGFEHQKFCLMESWYKDMILAEFQNFDILGFEPDDSEYMLKRYENERGKEYNKENDTKELIKYLIDNGAVINPWFLSITKRTKVEKNIIDRLELLYNLCIKPITIFYSNKSADGHEQIKATIKNNKWNRFLENYYNFYYIFTDERFSPEEVYRLLNSDSEKELVYYFAKKNARDEIDGVEYKYLKARVHNELSTWNKHKDEFFAKEKDIEEGLKEIPILEEKLKNGETTYFDVEEEDIGPNEAKEMYDYVCYWKYEQSYNDFLRKRNHKATESLRKEIDNLTLKEIRDKYFPREIYDYE